MIQMQHPPTLLDRIFATLLLLPYALHQEIYYRRRARRERSAAPMFSHVRGGQSEDYTQKGVSE